jgi:hypothetical protein
MNPKRPFLLGTAEVIDTLLPEVRRLLDHEGFYIGTGPSLEPGGEAPLVSIAGKLLTLVPGKELDPADIQPGNRFEGPFRAGDASMTDALRRIRDLCPGGELGDPEADRILAAIYDLADRALTEEPGDTRSPDPLHLETWGAIMSVWLLDFSTIRQALYPCRCFIDPATGYIGTKDHDSNLEESGPCVAILWERVWSDYTLWCRASGIQPIPFNSGGPLIEEPYFLKTGPNPSDLPRSNFQFMGEDKPHWVLRLDRMPDALRLLFAGAFESAKGETKAP